MTTTREVVTGTVRGMFKCRACKAVSRIDFERTRTRVKVGFQVRFYDPKWTRDGVPIQDGICGDMPVVRCACGGWAYGRPIVARVSEHKCDARCTSAKGHNCECSCGGENHGSDWSPVQG